MIINYNNRRVELDIYKGEVVQAYYLDGTMEAIADDIVCELACLYEQEINSEAAEFAMMGCYDSSKGH